jgi:DNA uptake protein ComE-like DNA-binding protein
VKDYISIRTSSRGLEKNYTGALNSKTERKVWNIELNSADTTALAELPGIGVKLAQRIINFRDRLGGFYSVDQVGETYGLADSIFKKIKPYLHINGGVKKININTATRDELKLHPYIKWNLANILVEYRNQHGHYKSLEELKNISSIEETLFLKIAPYLYKE